MDIRVKKTKKAIKEAFYELRSSQSPEKIKVKDLCTLAQINKTTFYKYYQDIYDLNSELEREAFTCFQNDFQVCDRLFSDPEAFIRGIPAALRSQWNLIYPIFHDRHDVFFNCLENDIMKFYLENHPQNLSDERVTFIISGTVRMLQSIRPGETPDEKFYSEVISIIKDLT